MRTTVSVISGNDNTMVVQYCQTYTDREDGKILIYDLYSSYGSWKGLTDRTDRTVRERIYGSWIQLFYRWKSQVVTKWSLDKFVDPHGSYGRTNWIMASRSNHTNRTVREKDLRIVNIVFNLWKCQVVFKWSLKKFVDPYIQSENGFTDRTHRTVRGKGLRIVNTLFQSVKVSVCD